MPLDNLILKIQECSDNTSLHEKVARLICGSSKESWRFTDNEFFCDFSKVDRKVLTQIWELVK